MILKEGPSWNKGNLVSLIKRVNIHHVTNIENRIVLCVQVIEIKIYKENSKSHKNVIRIKLRIIVNKYNTNFFKRHPLISDCNY